MNIRDELVSEVRKYLVGPWAEDEILPPSNHPSEHYTSGILFPQDAEPDALDSDDFETGNEDSDSRDSNDLVPPRIKQSTIGLRVDLADGIGTVCVELGYAKYDRIDEGWKRVPLRGENIHTIDLAQKEGRVEILGRDGMHDARLRWVFDEGGDGPDRHRVLNLFLENCRSWRKYDRDRDDFDAVRDENSMNTIFQPHITVRSDGHAFRRCRPRARGSIKTAEDQSLDLIFRDTAVFGEGFNCAATWDRTDDPSWVSTELVPVHTSQSIGRESTGGDGRPASVDMHRLSYVEGDDDGAYRRQFEENIRPVVDGYRKWIDSERRKMMSLEEADSPHAPAAKNSVRQCEEACRRMEDGLEFLLADGHGEARLAFALANRAMLYQRLHSEHVSRAARGEKHAEMPDPTRPGQSYWYPFQIAFLVMNVRGIVDRSAPERSEVDLLWFPTGGGKTEAYLAVAAFAMIHRRMRGGDGDGLGVAVIMRYTLRLLTLQQFERASILACALEFLRQNNPAYGLGDSPFLVGLWVGNKLTPNQHQAAEEIIEEQRARRQTEPAGSSPMQLIRCPWCGTRMDPFCYAMDHNRNWTLAHCNRKGCFFSHVGGRDPARALPILTVDSDIYSRCPSMIISTVDKFARMPYVPDTASIFGRVDRHCEKHGFLAAGTRTCTVGRHRDGKVRRISMLDGPDLIIQDELHLITGPLGSMVGLYETAVDYLVRRSGGAGTVPKIICSTATIRGADEQVRRLFNRDPPQKFPPPGIDRDDSFFWWESDKPGREHVGVSFSHRSSKYSLARVYASLLQKAKALSAALESNEIDPYWTLVGYFNSIRELGGSIRLVEDDVVSNIQFITTSIHGRPKSEMRNPGRSGSGMEELTGRVGQGGIRDIREKLEKTKDDLGCINTLLATNMISVGIDIERLGLMVVHGQTKNSSEYVQATGRIGRRPQIPGLVFTLYNPYKPRDLSHYENFTGYHSMLQRDVEPSTLTPFSAGAVERGIHSVLISMIRLTIPRLSGRNRAGEFERRDANEAISFILDRYMSVMQVGADDAGYAYARKYLESFADNWIRLIQKAEDDDATDDGVWYHNPYTMSRFSGVGDNPYVLMTDFSRRGGAAGMFPKATPESLRDVERTVKLSYT